MYESGIVVSGNGLQSPSTATRVRVEGGKRQVQDGPFADTHEHLGGYFIVETASLDDALEWAARAPAHRPAASRCGRLCRRRRTRLRERRRGGGGRARRP
uniref:YCII-related domain-containing protein n=1 Tax=Phenylobacterium glaciei TaxID=2803784 RepID=A0A974P6K6_9CAUL|nr:hypothetical protein JKL49_10010 [Phenylobacterium glaciei]